MGLYPTYQLMLKAIYSLMGPHKLNEKTKRSQGAHLAGRTVGPSDNQSVTRFSSECLEDHPN